MVYTHLCDIRHELELRDAADQRLHRVIAALALFLAPLGVVGGEVAFAVLLGASLARANRLWPVWIDALRSPVTPWLGALAIWAVLSLTWSPEPANGADRLWCLRALTWALLLYPLLREPRSRITLLLALLAGITVLGASQIWQWTHFGLFIAPKGELFEQIFAEKRFGGLHGEVGKAGIWSAAGVCIGIFLCASPRIHPHARLAAAAATLICLGGLWACASLRSIIPTALALPLAAFAAWPAHRTHHGNPRHAAIAIPVLAILAGLIVCIDRRVEIMTVAPQAHATAVHPSASVPTPIAWFLDRPSIAPRLAWWRGCWNGFCDHPLAGGGWGSTPVLIRTYEDAQGISDRESVDGHSRRKAPAVSQPHSLYVMALGELGGIGFALLMGAAWTLARYSVTAARACLELAGPAAATLVWLMAAAGDTVFNSAVLACGAILMSFVAPLPPGRLFSGSAVPVEMRERRFRER